MRHTLRRQMRRSEKGVVAVEAAFALVILAFLSAAAVHLADGMMTKQKMHSATTRAARVCLSASEGQAVDCAERQVEAALRTSGLADRCEPLNTDATLVPGPLGFSLLKVVVTCEYVGAGLGRSASGLMEDTSLSLRVQTTIPLRREERTL